MRRLTIVALALGLTGACAFAQTTAQPTGTVRGVVFTADPDGGRSVVPATMITLEGPAHLEAQSDNEGNFALGAVPPGSYTIAANTPGMAATQGVVVTAGTLSANADVFILQEVDINARRTHHLNVAQEIARKLRLNYVFGREFVELTQGSKSNPALHGQATLSPWKISRPRIIHFEQQSDFWKPRWYKPKLQTFQERLGGRIALSAEISIQSASIICYNVHLESRSNDELRLAQLNEVLHDAGGCDSTQPIVVAGDLNLNASKPAIADIPARVGFRDVVPSSRVPTTPSRHLLEAGRHIDWAFVRGPVQADAGKVHRSARGSDHYPISFELRTQSEKTS